MRDIVLQDELFHISHLDGSEVDLSDISSFQSIRGQGLENYLKNYALTDERAGTMRTYLVRTNSDKELAGYFSLKAGLISVNETTTEDGIVFDTLPGIEIANFAVNDRFLNRHSSLKGVGSVVFSHFIIPTILKVSHEIGVKIIYIFALPEESLVRRYTEYGFSRLSDADEDALHARLKPRYDEKCIFMYLVI